MALHTSVFKTGEREAQNSRSGQMLKLDLEREGLVVNYEIDERRLSVTRALRLEFLRRLRSWSINYGRMGCGQVVAFRWHPTTRQAKPSR
jgi:hypothetical protein